MWMTLNSSDMTVLALTLISVVLLYIQCGIIGVRLGDYHGEYLSKVRGLEVLSVITWPVSIPLLMLYKIMKRGK